MQEFIEKLIGRLEEAMERYEDVSFFEMNTNGHTLDFEYANGKKDGVSEAIEIVKQEAEKHDNGWISCSSGVMPRANGWYLVTNRLGVVQEQRWSANHWEKLRDDAVLAWRELPLPYQPKGDGK